MTDQVIDNDVGDVNADLESEATELGWKPKEQWKGDDSKWVDARTFMDKVGIILPVLRQKNQELHQTITSLRNADRARAAELAAIQEALDSVQKTQQEDGAQRAEALVEDLELEIEQASEAGDHKRIAKLTSQLAKLQAAQLVKAEKDAGAPAHKSGAPAQANPAFDAWHTENSWYGQDKKRSRLAFTAFQNVVEDSPQLQGKAIFDEVDRELARLEGRAAPRKTSRVAGGGSSGGEGGGDGGDKTFAALPADAKAACERQAKYVVGKGKAYPDQAAWQKAYARTYYAQESR